MNPFLSIFHRFAFLSSQLRKTFLILFVIIAGLRSGYAQILISGTSFDPTPANVGRYYIGLADISFYGLYSSGYNLTTNVTLAPNVNTNIFNATPYYAITDNPIKLDSTRYRSFTSPDNSIIFSPSTSSNFLLSYTVAGLVPGSNVQVKIRYSNPVSTTYSSCNGSVVSSRGVINSTNVNPGSGTEDQQLNSGKDTTYTWNSASNCGNCATVAADGNATFTLANMQTGSCNPVAIRYIEVYGTPQINIYAEEGSEICAGEQVTLKAYNSYNGTYKWEVSTNGGTSWTSFGT